MSTDFRHVPMWDLVSPHRSQMDAMLQAVREVLESGQYILGPWVEQFEARMAEWSGCSFAIGVNSGTDALVLALQALSIGPGDEVITCPNSFVASALAIELVGARPVLVDVGDDYNMNPDLLETVITPQTKAIMPVHLRGRVARMEKILSIAEKRNIPVVEDAAQALRSERAIQGAWRKAGSLGTLGCFSLHPLKNLSACGDGGVITTNDRKLAECLRELRNLGLRDRDHCTRLGRNSRLDSMQAALLLVRADKLNENLARRHHNVEILRSRLKDVVRVPELDPNQERPQFQTFVVSATRRDELYAFLEKRGIEPKVYYRIPIHLQPAFAHLGYKAGDFPETEKQSAEIIALPTGPHLTDDDMTWIVDSIRLFYA